MIVCYNLKQQRGIEMNEALQKALDFFGNKNRLAKAINYPPQNVGKWASGERSVQFKAAYLIEEATNGEVKKEALLK